jgi:hypothetical protein
MDYSVHIFRMEKIYEHWQTVEVCVVLCLSTLHAMYAVEDGLLFIIILSSFKRKDCLLSMHPYVCHATFLFHTIIMHIWHPCELHVTDFRKLGWYRFLQNLELLLNLFSCRMQIKVVSAVYHLIAVTAMAVKHCMELKWWHNPIPPELW